MLHDIFVPFRRHVVQPEPESEGSGLGLAVTERVVRRREGSVRALNAPDGGLVVETELPLVNSVLG